MGPVTVSQHEESLSDRWSGSHSPRQAVDRDRTRTRERFRNEYCVVSALEARPSGASGSGTEDGSEHSDDDHPRPDTRRCLCYRYSPWWVIAATGSTLLWPLEPALTLIGPGLS